MGFLGILPGYGVPQSGVSVAHRQGGDRGLPHFISKTRIMLYFTEYYI